MGGAVGVAALLDRAVTSALPHYGGNSQAGSTPVFLAAALFAEAAAAACGSAAAGASAGTGSDVASAGAVTAALAVIHCLEEDSLLCAAVAAAAGTDAHQMGQLCACFYPLLADAPEAGGLFQAGARMYAELGRATGATPVSVAAFRSLGLPPLLRLLRHGGAKRGPLVRIVFAFATPTTDQAQRRATSASPASALPPLYNAGGEGSAGGGPVRWLLEGLNDLPTFLQCLPFAVRLGQQEAGEEAVDVSSGRDAWEW